MGVDPVEVQRLFSQASEIESPSARAAFVREAVQGNARLSNRVLRLLDAHQLAGDFIEEPLAGVALTADAEDRISTCIGPYKLLERLGEGGMGVVYLAEQQTPIKRQVALKVLKPGLATRDVIARFEAERQAIALMDHPNVAKALDAGETGEGRPYFAMELIRGTPITEYCQSRELPLQARLSLFGEVCRAVQHAHHKGVIHRDLKPSNVLVADYDDTPVPKVIDFGVAKAIGAQLTDKTLFTRYGQVIGTLSYMSPEQAKLNQLDVDTRSDVYSLGVLLYELITGGTPTPTAQLESAPLDEALRTIREVTPAPPSTQMTLPLPLESATQSRGASRQRGWGVRGDLDWIALKALEKKREDRYQTAGDFADDIGRFLEGRPTAARPIGPGRRLARWLRRHPVATACLVMATAAAVLLAGFEWRGSRLRRDQAVQALVERVMSADGAHLGLILEQPLLADRLAVASIGDRLRKPGLLETERVNLLIARTAVTGRDADEDLEGSLAEVGLDRASPAVDALAEANVSNHAARWRRLAAPESGADERLLLAMLLAKTSPSDERWEGSADRLAEDLVGKSPLEVAGLLEALTPIAGPLSKPLAKIVGDPDRSLAIRLIASDALSRVSGDRDAILQGLIGAPKDARPLLLGALKSLREDAAPILEATLAAPVSIREPSPGKTPTDSEHAYDTALRKQAIAARGLWEVGGRDQVISVLAERSDPSLRAWVIEVFRETPVADPSALLPLSDRSPDLCRALWPAEEKRDPAESPPRPGPNGHQFVRVPAPGGVELGSLSADLWREEGEGVRKADISYDYEVATTEVTCAQFRAFRRHDHNLRYGPTEDCPVNNVSFYDAIAYCRWLSENEEVPEAQMCYPPLDEIGPGMSLESDWLARSGYRLPTRDEWEHACRAGTTSARFWGEGSALLTRYANALPASDDRSKPVASLLPNRWGLYDTLGNIGELCHPPGAAGKPGTSVLRMGGDFGDVPSNVRAGRPSWISPGARWANTGFRVVRTISAQSP